VKWIAPVAVLFLLLAGISDAHACRTYLHNARLEIRQHVEALGEIETQALNRLMGGIWPSYEYLAQEALTIAAVIYPQSAAIGERRMRRCRNWVPPVRRTCREAAMQLVEVIEQSAARRLSEQARLDYARLIEKCERWLAIPRQSRWLRMP
jgi:hypothetical protein